MNWKKYELEILKYFRQLYPGTQITFDKKIIGKFSKTKRQIDIFIEGEIAGFEIKIVVDCKYFSKSIDIKQIESFCSMVEDIDAHQGILITSKGYSKGAINRAFYGGQKVELDILNFNKIKKFQNFSALPYVGNFSVFLPAPFGWVLDIEDKVGGFASLFQRGLTLKEAQKKNEWMYIQFWKKKPPYLTLDDLIEHQNKNIQSGKKVNFDYKSGPKRKDNCNTKVRIADVELYPALEVTGFIEFEETIFFIVLFTPKELFNKNLRKLQYLLSMAEPMEINFDNSKVIEQALEEIPQIVDLEKKANTFYQISMWYKEMKDTKNTFIYLEKAIKSLPTHYFTLKSLIIENLIHKQFDQAKKYSNIFLEVEPTNPRISQDLIEIYLDQKHSKLLIGFFESQLKVQESFEVLGNINYHLGILNNSIENEKEAIPYFKSARKYFRKVFDEDNPVFENLKILLKK